MSEASRITFEELVKGCFHYIETIRVGKSQVGGYVVRYAYKHPPNLHGKQIIWLLYHPESIELIEKELRHIRGCLEAWDRNAVFIVDHNPDEVSLAVDVALLADGAVSFNAFTLQREDGVEGHIGVIVGQGRVIDLDEPGITGLIHILLADALKHLKTPFIAWGLERLEEFKAKLSKQGAKFVEVKVDKHGNVLKPTQKEEP